MMDFMIERIDRETTNHAAGKPPGSPRR